MSEDLNQPATKADIDELAQITDSAIQKAVEPLHNGVAELGSSVDELQTSVKELKTSVKELQKGQKKLQKGQEDLQKEVGSLKRGQQAILTVVESIDEQLKHHRNLPERVARLERTAFR